MSELRRRRVDLNSIVRKIEKKIEKKAVEAAGSRQVVVYK